MPKFHFEIVDGYTIKDPVGIDLKGQEEAQKLAHDIARQIRVDLGETSVRKVIVVDERGEEIYGVPVKSNQ